MSPLSHTGLLVLKELGFVVDKYVASEIDMDAVNVTGMFSHLSYTNPNVVL